MKFVHEEALLMLVNNAFGTIIRNLYEKIKHMFLNIRQEKWTARRIYMKLG